MWCINFWYECHMIHSCLNQKKLLRRTVTGKEELYWMVNTSKRFLNNWYQVWTTKKRKMCKKVGGRKEETSHIRPLFHFYRHRKSQRQKRVEALSFSLSFFLNDYIYSVCCFLCAYSPLGKFCGKGRPPKESSSWNKTGTEKNGERKEKKERTIRCY